MPAWTPGASGNKRGRPPKGRALTEILQKVGNGSVKRGDTKVARKRVLADMLWTAALTGQVILVDNGGDKALQHLVLDSDEWFDVVKFLYSHIDGPPKAGLLDDLPEDRNVEIKLIRTEGRKPTTQEADDPEPDA